MVVEMVACTVHSVYMSEAYYTRCINDVILLWLWAYVALYVLCAAPKDSAEEMYFYYSLFLTTACTMNAFVLHLCRYMHMVQIKQHHTHIAGWLFSSAPRWKKVGVQQINYHIANKCLATFLYVWHCLFMLPRLGKSWWSVTAWVTKPGSLALLAPINDKHCLKSETFRSSS